MLFIMERVLGIRNTGPYFGFLRCALVCICGVLLMLFDLVHCGDVYADCSIGMVTDNEVTLNLVGNVAGVVENTVIINSDCANGYSVYISGPEDSTLYKDGDNTSHDYILPVSGNREAPTTLSTDTYGYSLQPGTTAFSDSFIGLTGTRTLLVSREEPSEPDGDDITVYYGARIGNLKPPGSYSMANGGSIVYYALANGIAVVNFDANGGTIPAGNDWVGSGNVAIKEIDGNTYGSMPEPTREGYTFMGWSKNNLSEEYQELDYVKFNQGSYIDTGIIPTNHMTEVKFDYETYTSDEFLLGTSLGSSYYYTSSYNNKYVFGHDGNKSWTGYGSWTTGDHHLIYNGDNNEIVLDGELLESGYGISSTTTLWIGRRGNTANLSGKVYYVKITDKTTNELVRDFVPCYRRQDWVVGLCETVENVFYTNNGTNVLTVGTEASYIVSSSELITRSEHTLYAIWRKNPTISFDANGGTVDVSSKTIVYDSYYGELPVPVKDGYTFGGWSAKGMINSYYETSYITLTGTQYIDTNYALWRNQDWKMEFKFDVSQFYSYDNMFGSLSTINTDNEIWIDSSGAYYIRIGGISKTKIAGLTLDTPYTIMHDNTGSSLLNYVDGALVSSLRRANTNFAYTLGFGHRNGSSYLKGKIYYLKFWSDGELVRDMVPCYGVDDGVVGLCDVANGGLFYPNAGSGVFGKGEDIESIVTEDMKVVTNYDHTLYAIWE